jgi:hypothetical protein
MLFCEVKLFLRLCDMVYGIPSIHPSITKMFIAFVVVKLMLSKTIDIVLHNSK